MTTPAPNLEALPLCRALATEARRPLFVQNIHTLLISKSHATKLDAMLRLQGMVEAYYEADAIDSDRFKQLSAELTDFVWGQA